MDDCKVGMEDYDLMAALELSLNEASSCVENEERAIECNFDQSEAQTNTFVSEITGFSNKRSTNTNEAEENPNKKRNFKQKAPLTESHDSFQHRRIVELLEKRKLTVDQIVSFVDNLRTITPFCKDLMGIIRNMYEERNEYRKTVEKATLFRQNLDSWLTQNLPDCVCLENCKQSDMSTAVREQEIKVENGDNCDEDDDNAKGIDVINASICSQKSNGSVREAIVECLLAKYDSQVSGRFENYQHPPSKEHIWQCENLLDCLVSPISDLSETCSANRQRLNNNCVAPSCPVCLTNVVDCIMVSCGHALCSECGKDIVTNCPVCRQEVQFDARSGSAFLKIYFA